MEPVSLILGALLAGATKGVGEAAASAVKDAYTGFRALLGEKLRGRPAAEAAVEQYTADPEEWRPALEAYLRQAQLTEDVAVLEAAAAVLAAADPEGARASRYTINVSGSQGVQVGSHNTQTNTFGAPPAG